MVSLPILVVTAALQPFKNRDDNILSLAVQSVLVFSYFCCTILRISNSSDISDDAKQQLLGFTSSKGIFIAFGCCLIGTMMMILASYLYRINEAFHKHVRSMTIDKNFQEGSAWTFMGAACGSVLALAVGGGIYGLLVAFVA
eukprot:2679235-Prymnesium_polylepis.3